MAKLHRSSVNEYVFHCPGCHCGHAVRVIGSDPVWSWNGSVDNPTFNPSILLRGTEFTDKGEAQYESWRSGEIDCPEHFDSKPTICHSFVRDGKIQFLTDYTHSLAGKTIDIPEWES